MNKQVYGIFFNDQSGDGRAKSYAQKLATKLQQTQAESVFITGEDPKDAIDKIKIQLRHINVLIIIGGDGTINLAFTALLMANADIPVGLIPAGTVNNFAKRFSIPLNFEDASSLIAGNWNSERVGVGLCNGSQAIVSSLVLGNLADISNDVRQQEKRKFGKLVYIGKAIKKIGRNQSVKLNYQIDGNSHRSLKTWFALLTTTKSVGGHVYDKSDPDKLHLSLLHDIGLSQVIPYVFFALTGKLRESKSIDHFTLNKVKITATNKIRVQTRIDGDAADDLPVIVEYLPERISLIAKSKQ